MNIMTAMEFQELTMQKIQKLIGLVAETGERCLSLLVRLPLEDTTERVPDAKSDGGADAPTLWSQDLIDQLFQEVKGESATSPGSSADGRGRDPR